MLRRPESSGLRRRAPIAAFVVIGLTVVLWLASAAAGDVTSPPVNTALPAISGNAAQGATLTASTGLWTGSPSSFAYQWQDCDSSGANCTNIAGATGSSYSLQSSDVGDAVEVVVTASSVGGSASVSSLPTAVVSAVRITERSGFPVYGLNAANGTGPYAQTITTQAVGDLVIVGGSVGFGPTLAASNPISDTNGRVSGWRCSGYSYPIALKYVYLCWGSVTSTGSTTLEIALSGAPSSPGVEINTGEFASSIGASTAWTGDGPIGRLGNSSNTTVTWPSLTPGNSAELYWGYAEATNTLQSGTGPTGWRLEANTNGDGQVWAAGSSIQSGVAAQPTASQSPAGSSATIAELFTASRAGAPTNLALPVVTGNDLVGSTLTATTGSWANSPSSFAYQWQDCDSSGANCTNIAGATGSGYALGSGDANRTIRVVVTMGGITASSPSTAVVTGGASVPCSSSCLTSEDVVGSSGGDGDSSNGGMNWGQHKLKVARTTDGTLFAIQSTGSPGSDDKPYTLFRSTDEGSTWTAVDSGNDGGRETPLLLTDPGTNRVYLIIQPSTCPSGVNFCSPAGSAYGEPVIVSEGVDAVGPRTATAIPGSWAYPSTHMYSGAAIDASGNIYYQENLVSNGVTDAGYEGQLAWTTGGVGHLAWHFTQLPAVGGSGSAQDGRYAYTYELPDGRGGIDVIGVSDVSCENSAWAGAYGYTISSADQTGDCYILDRVEDWHTSNLNASGGPTWTMTEIASYTNTTACPLTNGVNIMLSLDDAYRDTDGNIHVLTSPCASAGATDTHYVLSGGSVTTSAPLPVGYCDAPHMRIIQDYSGRFWLFSNCNSNQIYSWHSGLPTTDPYGLSLGPEQTITTTHVLDGYPYLYLAAPRAGLPQNQKYLDLVAPYNNYTGLLHFRIKLDQ